MPRPSPPRLNSPTGLVLLALGKPSSNVPFMMPKRIAETSPNEQIKEYVGSGPFVFKADEWKPGDKAVFVKFAKYKPRAEAALGPGRRQGGQGRSHRVARHSRCADRRQRAGRRRDRHGRGSEERTAAGAGEGPEHQALRPEPAGQPVRDALQHTAQALRQPEDPPGRVHGAEPGGLPEGGARRPEVLQGVQGAVHLRLAAGHRQGHGRPARIELQEVARDAEGGRATTARRWC